MTLKSVMVDGLIGPTYHFGGLSLGNVPSMTHQYLTSNPKKAALQGLEKMWHVSELGIPQFVLPPQDRDYCHILRQLGFKKNVLKESFLHDKYLLSAVFSASSAWVANALTWSSSFDTKDGKCHYTPANLVTCFHRSLEIPYTVRELKRLFQDNDLFSYHTPLKSSLADEGSANMIRFSSKSGKGVYVCVYGATLSHQFTARYPARQYKESFEMIMRRHRLFMDRVIFAQQTPDVIDKGVFHNDLIAFGAGSLCIVHEKAFVDQAEALSRLKNLFYKQCGETLKVVTVMSDELSVDDAISTYFFNSQLISISSNRYVLIVPDRCKYHVGIQSILDRLCNDVDLDISYVCLEESIKNGGGPACLRCTLALTDQELDSLNTLYRLTEKRFDALHRFITTSYPEEITLECFLESSFVTHLQMLTKKLRALWC